MTKILDGKSLSSKLALQLTRKVGGLSTKPKLVIIQIGNLAESNVYIRNKKAFGERIGTIVEHRIYPNTVREDRLISHIKKFNRDSAIHGIMVQLPAPKNFDIERVLESIDYRKDVDGLTAINTKHLFDNQEAFVPATAKGIVSLLDASKIKIAGAKVVVVGQSTLVGRPTMLAFLNRGATVTICHKDTKNLERETKQADILITAVGKQKLIKVKHVSKNQVIIDIGINVTNKPTADGLGKKIVGDVDFKNVSRVVKAITPVPGGVGPMTVASLFQNLLEAYVLQAK